VFIVTKIGLQVVPVAAETIGKSGQQVGGKPVEDQPGSVHLPTGMDHFPLPVRAGLAADTETRNVAVDPVVDSKGKFQKNLLSGRGGKEAKRAREDCTCRSRQDPLPGPDISSEGHGTMGNADAAGRRSN
jgi:hypothetical protein